MNIAQIAEEGVEKFGEYVSTIFKDKEYTNVDMIRMAGKMGNVFKALGVKRGDRVIMQLPNCIEVLAGFQAIARIGSIVVPVNFLIGPGESAHIYQDSGGVLVMTSSEFLDKIEKAKSKAPNLEKVILTDKKMPDTLYLPELIEESSDKLDIVDTADEETAALIYTAGTTGRPKGVMLSHHALYSNAKMQVETVQLSRGDVGVSALPLCHSYGIASMNASGLIGGKGVILDKFDIEEIFQSIDKYQGRTFTGVPAMYAMMNRMHSELKEKYDWSSMKYWICGAAPLPLETAKEFKEKFGKDIIEGWGLTEAGANNSVNPIDGPYKVGSIGKPMKGTEMRVVDENGNELPSGEWGEIVLRGPMLMKGYWNKPEKTEKVLRDGWLHTGDIGYVDEDGYFWLTDRKKDLILRGGENIYPREVEEVLIKHPKVEEVGVIGIPDEVYGEEVKAYVVLKQEKQVSEQDLIEFSRKELPKFKFPKSISFIDSLPKNLVGKILRKDLRKLHEEETKAPS